MVITNYEVVLGGITMVVVLEAVRRVLGNTLPALALIFLPYCRFGSYTPAFLKYATIRSRASSSTCT